MTPFPQPLSGIPAPLIRDNIDTDTIIPSREMRTTGREGLADGLFAPWRYSDADKRAEDSDFVLNRPAYRDATILLGGANFGCGSSREHAVWALREWGIDCIIADSFAPIFYGNCIRNGILPVTLERDAIERLIDQVIAIDLVAQIVTAQGLEHPFTIGAEARQMLLEGLDAIDLTMTMQPAIKQWTMSDRTARPWVYLEQMT